MTWPPVGFAGSRALQIVDASHERRFARAGHADDAVDLALMDAQVDVPQGLHGLHFASERLCQMPEFDERQDAPLLSTGCLIRLSVVRVT